MFNGKYQTPSETVEHRAESNRQGCQWWLRKRSVTGREEEEKSVIYHSLVYCGSETERALEPFTQAKLLLRKNVGKKYPSGKNAEKGRHFFIFSIQFY